MNIHTENIINCDKMYKKKFLKNYFLINMKKIKQNS